MCWLFRDYPEAIHESARLFSELQFSLDELRYEYPEETIGQSATPQAELERLTWLGAQQRFPDGVPASIRQTINHELKIIADLKYAPYFLTVYDIVRFARNNKILCQGRGSAASSSVCYCLSGLFHQSAMSYLILMLILNMSDEKRCPVYLSKI